MDEEQREAQNLTKDDLLAKLESGRPAELARQRPELSSEQHGAFVELRAPTSSATISVRESSFGPEVHGIMVSSLVGVSVS